jgi:adenosylmethionine-8-amino-7-oxononanoate aminotransferase
MVEARVSKRTQELLDRDARYKAPYMSTSVAPTKIVFEKGEGSLLWDTEGNEYIDICNSNECVNLGYGRIDISNAIKEQMDKLHFAAVMAPITHDIVGEFCEKVVGILPAGLGHVYSVTGGSTAVEAALKIAKTYWFAKGKATKFKVICLQNAYHGNTALTGNLMSANLLSSPGLHAIAGPETYGVIHAAGYHCYRCPFGLRYPECNVLCARNIENVIFNEGEDTVAAFIVEPEQGVGGGILPVPEYFPIVSKICKDHNVLLITDEVMSGFCRTGKMFAIEYTDTKPDIMTLAKGLTSSYWPMGAVVMTDEVYSAFESVPLPVSFTYVGHPCGCAAAIACIDAYRNEKVAENATKVGTHIRERLEKEFTKLPSIDNVGGLGCFLSFEILQDKASKTPISADFLNQKLTPALWKAGVFPRLNPFGYPGVRMMFAPACNISQELADKALDKIYPVFKGMDKI